MTDLSPAAQAVLDAFGTYPLRAGNIGEDLIPALAAALRAAAVHAYCPVDRQRLYAITTELEGNHTSENV